MWKKFTEECPPSGVPLLIKTNILKTGYEKYEVAVWDGGTFLGCGVLGNLIPVGGVGYFIEISKLNMGNKMAKLTTKSRKSLPKSDFGLPDERKYPMPDKSHAANAKARATQMVNKGKLSKSAEKKIDAKANKILGKGKAK